jgi:hypothetical protein
VASDIVPSCGYVLNCSSFRDDEIGLHKRYDNADRIRKRGKGDVSVQGNNAYVGEVRVPIASYLLI